jgi:hypothetical protein
VKQLKREFVVVKTVPFIPYNRMNKFLNLKNIEIAIYWRKMDRILTLPSSLLYIKLKIDNLDWEKKDNHIFNSIIDSFVKKCTQLKKCSIEFIFRDLVYEIPKIKILR